MSDQLLLERRYQGEHPLRTLLVLFKGEYTHLTLAILLYIVKHAGVWGMPLITANIIDIVTDPARHSINHLWFYIGILAFVLILTIPTHYLFIL